MSAIPAYFRTHLTKKKIKEMATPRHLLLFVSLVLVSMHTSAQYTPLEEVNIGDSIAIISLRPMDLRKQPILKHTAFFCKMENRVARKARIPLRVRLGSLNYVNQIENKYFDHLKYLNLKTTK